MSWITYILTDPLTVLIASFYVIMPLYNSLILEDRNRVFVFIARIYIPCEDFILYDSIFVNRVLCVLGVFTMIANYLNIIDILKWN